MKKINRIDEPYPTVYIDDFFPNVSLLRAAAESYNLVDDWVKYGEDWETLNKWQH